MSYSFWCSNCKISHAGECPPKKVYPRGYAIDLKPTVGSRWVEENFDGFQWVKRKLVVVWEVMEIDEGASRAMCYNGHIYSDTPLEAFTEEGAVSAMRYRLRPAP